MPVALASLLAALILVPPAAAAPVAHRGLSYDLDGNRPSPARFGQLDLYVPAAVRPGARRGVVAFVHGGGWRRGDKGFHIADKARLFTGAGYVFASINYRLSPDPPALDRPRTRFPAHPSDVGEALAWLHERARRFGGDGDRIAVMGHSAGAHLASLVATDPRYVRRLGAPASMVRGLVSLDGAAFDIPRAMRQAAGSLRLVLLENAFGTRAEQRRDPRWGRASPLAHAGREDPPALVVQQDRPSSLAVARPFKRALGPDAQLMPVEKSHEEINRHLGSPADRSRMTTRVLAFVDSVLRRGR